MFLMRPEHIVKIQRRKKTQTRRVSKTWRAKVGSIHQIRAKLFGPSHCRIKVLRRWEERLGNITDSDAMAEGGYTRIDYILGFLDMHHNTITVDAIVKCYEFELVDEQPPVSMWRVRSNKTGVICHTSSTREGAQRWSTKFLKEHGEVVNG